MATAGALAVEEREAPAAKGVCLMAVLISIHPEWCEKIASGQKTMEVRKTRPKLETPFKCYIYCTKGHNEALWRYQGEYYYDTQFPNERPNTANSKVIGEFVCDSIRCFDVPYPAFQSKMDKQILEQSCLTYYQLHRYAYHEKLYGWHISDLVIYDKPKELSEFRGLRKTKFGLEPVRLNRPPQSWCYVEEVTP